MFPRPEKRNRAPKNNLFIYYFAEICNKNLQKTTRKPARSKEQQDILEKRGVFFDFNVQAAIRFDYVSNIGGSGGFSVA